MASTALYEASYWFSLLIREAQITIGVLLVSGLQPPLCL